MAHGNNTPKSNPLALLQDLQARKNSQNQQPVEAESVSAVLDDAPAPSTTVNQAEHEAVPPTPPKQKSPEKPKSAGQKTAGKKKAPVVESDSKLRKTSSDPEAVRVSARIPNEYYMDMMHLRAAYGQSMDYTITHALHAFLYDKFTCPSGHSFYVDSNENGAVTPTVCPVCGDRSIRKAKTGR